MGRKAVLTLLSLAVVAAAYWALAQGDRPVGGGGVARVLASRSAPSSAPLQFIRGGEVPLGPGDRPYFRVLNRDTGETQFEFRAAEWAPREGSDDTFEVSLPELRIHMPGGQMAHVFAERAELQLMDSGRNAVNLRNGAFRGDVRLVLDRTTRAWREAHPERRGLDQHPEQVARIWLGEEARLDMEVSRLSADGQIRMESAEAAIVANPGRESLVVSWDQIDNRIEYLAFQYGGRMELRRGGGLVQFAMPGTELPAEPGAATEERGVPPETAGEPALHRANVPRALRAAAEVPAEQAATEIRAVLANRPRRLGEGGTHAAPVSASLPAVAAAATRPAGEGPGDVAPGAGGKPKPPRVDTYAALLKDRVRVEQTRGGTVTGTLESDSLELVFDIGEQQRRSQTFVPSSAPGSRPGDRRNDDTQLVVTWTGRLEMRPAQAGEGEPSGRRFDAIAAGAPLRLRDAQGQVTCERMVYRGEHQAVWFSGSQDRLARLESLDGRRAMAAAEIMLNRSVGAARLTGAGWLHDRGDAGGASPSGGAGDGASAAQMGGSREPFEVRWSSGVEMELGRRSAGQDAQAPRVDFLRRAWFHGDVAMRQGQRALTGREVGMTFGPPRRRGALADHLTHLSAAGDVRLADGDDVLTGRALEVELVLTGDGRNVPVRGEARGDVRLEQPGRSFSADAVDADFAMVPADRATGAPATRARVSRVRAERRVSVRDAEQQLEVDAHRLDARFDPQGKIVAARLFGAGEAGPAFAQQGDYAVSGHDVTIAVPDQRIEVVGAGHAAFVTVADFDGRRLDRPTAVNIVFSNGMTLDGRENTGVFTGYIRTSTDTHELACEERLLVRFRDAAAPDGAGAASQAAPPLQPWTVVGWLSGKFVAQPDPQPAAPRLRKRPSYARAEGNAVGLTTDYDEDGRVRGRMRIAGPTIEAELREERLNVAGRGSLWVEDYRPPRRQGGGADASAAPDAGVTAPSLGAGDSSGPSQTLFVWSNAMSFHAREGLATFDRNVQLTHRSGATLLTSDVSAAMLAGTDALRLGPGRHATLNCDALTAQFAVAERQPGDAAAESPGGRLARSRLDIRWNEVRRVSAVGRVHLQEGPRSLMGESLLLDGETNVLTLRGRPGFEAVLIEEDEASQRLRSWRGPEIRWNRTTGVVEAPSPTMTSR